MPNSVTYVGVCGASNATPELYAMAEEVGERLAHGGAVIISGGRGGVMEASCKGAHNAGGTTVGLLPGDSRDQANPHCTVTLPTGMGELRNGLIVRAADVLIAVGGAYGTLSEIALALHAGKPVIALQTWALDVPELIKADTPEQAVKLAFAAARRG